MNCPAARPVGHHHAALTVALCGNPNTGKSTLFNALTGRSQHVGNWPGKTVEKAEGKCCLQGRWLKIVDLPGTYSLAARTTEEIIARNFILGGKPDVVVAVVDATSLERGLYLVLQILELVTNVVVALNMMDAADQAGLSIDTNILRESLGVPVVPVSAATGRGLQEMVAAATAVAVDKPASPKPASREKGPGWPVTVTAIQLATRRHQLARKIARAAVTWQKPPRDLTRRIDQVVTHPWLAVPVMLALFLGVLTITIYGASPFTELLDRFFNLLARETTALLLSLHAPPWISGPLVDGLIVGVGAVISVMLPTMTIFFILFALLEDSGFIPRLAFNLDRVMQAVGSQGKHCLTCLMGYGCNIPGVMSARILEGRHRTLAILTNSLIPCNGRLGVILPLSALFFGERGSWVTLSLLLLSLATVMLATAFLSLTVLRGENPPFLLELPPYRRPQIKRVLERTLREKVFHVLVRASLVAAPMTLLIWFLSNYPVGAGPDHTFTGKLVRLLGPAGHLLGLDGRALVAMLYALPAKEIVLGALAITGGLASSLQGSPAVGDFLRSTWSPVTAYTFLVFFMLYLPCAYTASVIYKETRNLRWTAWGLLLPLALAVMASLAVHRLATLLRAI